MDQIKQHPLYRKHNIDSAMNALWEFYRSRFAALFLISLGMSLVLQLPGVLIDFKDLSSISDPKVILENPSIIFDKIRPYLLPLAGIMVVSLFFNVILHYYILCKPLNPDKNIFVCLIQSLRYFIPYLIIVIILAFVGSFLIAMGLMVFIIGVFFSIIYIGMLSLFILPAMMVEGPHIGNVITRTGKLAHTGFWTNFGWTAVFFVLMIVISIVLSGLVLIPFAGSFIQTFANPQDTSKIMGLTTNPLFLLLSSAINALTLPLYPIFSYIIYFNGIAREEKIELPKSDNGSEYKVRVEDLYAKPRDEESRDNQ